MLPFEGDFSEKRCVTGGCLLLKRGRGERALSSRSPADLALARDEGPGRGDAAFLLNRRFVRMGKKCGEVLEQGERLEVQPTRVSPCGMRWGTKQHSQGGQQT